MSDKKIVEAKFGGVQMQTLGAFFFGPNGEKRIREADDDDLIRALCARGYDVKAIVPRPEVLEKRRARAEKQKAARRAAP